MLNYFQKDLKRGVRLMQQLDLQDELCRTRQRFLKKHPGLEQYLRQEKALLLVLMLFVCAQPVRS